jgi:hypothetical protein
LSEKPKIHYLSHATKAHAGKALIDKFMKSKEMSCSALACPEIDFKWSLFFF